MPTETPKPVQRVENAVSDTIPETVMVDAVRNTTGCKNTDELLAYMKKLITSDGEAAKHLSGIPEDNTKVVDVTVRISMDGGLTWEDATAENFLAEGVDVLLPYPSETLRENNGQYDFVVGHLMTSGPNAGKMEYFTPEKTEEGLKVHVYSTSPFVIGWNEKASEPGENQNPAQPTDSGKMEAQSPKTYDSSIASDMSNIFDTVWFPVVAVLLGCAVSVVMMYFHKKKERDR